MKTIQFCTSALAALAAIAAAGSALPATACETPAHAQAAATSAQTVVVAQTDAAAEGAATPSGEGVPSQPPENEEPEGYRGKSPCERLERSLELFNTMQCEGQTDPDCVVLSETIDKLKTECNPDAQ